MASRVAVMHRAAAYAEKRAADTAAALADPSLSFALDLVDLLVPGLDDAERVRLARLADRQLRAVEKASEQAKA